MDCSEIKDILLHWAAGSWPCNLKKLKGLKSVRNRTVYTIYPEIRFLFFNSDSISTNWKSNLLADYRSDEFCLFMSYKDPIIRDLRSGKNVFLFGHPINRKVSEI